MKYAVLGASALAMTAATAQAGGVDRSGQSIAALFETGTYAEFSFGMVDPTVSGTSVASLGLVGNRDSEDMTESYLSFGAAVKHDYSEQFSVALIFDQPFGADVDYESGTGYYAQGSNAQLRANALTALARYKFNENVAVHGGLRYQTLEGNADVNNFNDLSGFGFGVQQVLAYEGELEKASGWGYVLGATYEVPEIALRVALTYNSAIETEHDTSESGLAGFPAAPIGGDSTTTIEAPQSVNLTFQTGVAADTLVFGGVRWVNWSEFDITPTVYQGVTGASLVSYDDDTYTYTLGVGRRFNDMWASSVSIGYEPQQGGISSNLGPTDGFWSLGLGGSYTSGPLEVSMGVRYVWIGDAETQNNLASPAASFEDNDAIGVGMKVGYTF